MASRDPVQDEESQRLLAALAQDTDEALALARWMSAHPELSLEERATSDRYVAYLSARGFAIERGVAGLETAFVARRGSGALHAALLAEMDALPEIGHACGHNLIAGAAVGAFLALAKHAGDIKGTVELLGTPAEENGGGKIRLLEAGAFEGVDAALMVHPSGVDLATMPCIAIAELEVTYRGVAAHASAMPERGVNALDALVLA